MLWIRFCKVKGSVVYWGVKGGCYLDGIAKSGEDPSAASSHAEYAFVRADGNCAALGYGTNSLLGAGIKGIV